MDFGELGKHPVSDRDTVIKELKALGKWKGEDQIGNISNSTGNESNKNHSAPGFGLLGGLVCLYGGWKLKKK